MPFYEEEKKSKEGRIDSRSHLPSLRVKTTVFFFCICRKNEKGEKEKKIKENEDKNIIENENKKSLVFFFLGCLSNLTIVRVCAI